MIIYTKHILERIKQRNLNLQDINDIINDQNLEGILDKNNNFIKQRIIKGYLLRVIYRLENENIIIISAYKTSKIDKYFN